MGDYRIRREATSLVLKGNYGVPDTELEQPSGDPRNK
jgi:hypothetical protein